LIRLSQIKGLGVGIVLFPTTHTNLDGGTEPYLAFKVIV
jgi:hypothetical protein